MSNSSRAGLPTRLADLAVLIILAVLAFLLTLKTGMRGFYPFDQSIVFDGSYRVLSGQIPYKDFVMPFGPVTFWLHAVFFRLLGVTYFAYVFGAAAINVLAMLASIVLVRTLFPGRRLLSYVAGLVTAVWFYPPFGTPWFDQTAFFFSLVGITALMAGVVAEPRRARLRDALLAASGLLAFLTLASKQNAGAFMLPAYPLLILAAELPDRRSALRSLGVFAAGLGATLAAFAIWLWAFSDPGIFARYVLKLAMELGQGRLRDFVTTGFGTWGTFFGGRGPLVMRLVSLGALGTAIAFIVRARRDWLRPERSVRRSLVAAVLCAYGVGFQHIFIRTTLNQPENGLGLGGVICGLAAGLALGLVGPARPGQRLAGRRGLTLALWVVIAVAVAASTVSGLRVGLTRKVQDIFTNPQFGEPFEVKGLKGLRWAEPTQMGNYRIEGRDVTALLTYLRGSGENFFIFPDFTLMYGLAGVPSPQPLLWFHEGVTYPKGSYDAGLDRWIVGKLIKNRVRIIVIEQVAWFNTGKRLDAFPELGTYIHTNFVHMGTIGMFSVYGKAPLRESP